MGNSAQGLKNKPCERVKGSFQQSYPQFLGSPSNPRKINDLPALSRIYLNNKIDNLNK
jgi:hypothetical protein